MAAHMMAPGKTITCMGKELTHGVTDANMKENTTWIRSTDMVSISGQMAEDTKATGKMESSMGKENIFFPQVL